jgi:hypothetical protein
MNDILRWTTGVIDPALQYVTWQPAQDFPSPYTSSASPSLSVFDSKLWLMHLGGGENQNLWYVNYTVESGWRNGEWQVTDKNGPVKSYSKPTLVNMNNATLECGYLGISHQDPTARQQVSFIGTQNGRDWSNPLMERSLTSSSAPISAAYRDGFWCVYRHLQTSELWSGLLYPTGEVDDYDMAGNKTSAAPALAVYKDKFWCVYRGYDDNRLYVTTSNHGGEVYKWSPGVPIGDHYSDCEPTLAYIPGLDILACVYGDANGAPKLYFTYTNAANGRVDAWSYAMEIPQNPRNPGTGAGLAYYQNKFYIAYRSA